MKYLPKLRNRADILGIIDPSNGSVVIDTERKLQVQDIMGRSTEAEIAAMVQHAIDNRTVGRLMWVVSQALSADDAERVLTMVAKSAAQKAVESGLQVQQTVIDELSAENGRLRLQKDRQETTILEMDGQLQRLRVQFKELQDENTRLKALVQKAEQLKSALQSFLK